MKTYLGVGILLLIIALVSMFWFISLPFLIEFHKRSSGPGARSELQYLRFAQIVVCDWRHALCAVGADF